MKVAFNVQDRPEFFQTLNKRVNAYFTENKISRQGGWKLAFKTFVMVFLFWGSYTAILTLGLPKLAMLGLCVVMAIGMAGIGMCVMHDANHNAYSKNRKVNRLIGYISDLVGVSSFNWQIKHNVLHHTFTNIDGVDEDIEMPDWLMRFCDHSKLYKLHRYQWLYASLLYGLMTITWSTYGDYFSFFRHKKNPAVNMKNPWPNFFLLVGFKLLYLFAMLVVPTVLLDLAFWEVFLGFFVIHFFCGLILSNIFQLAHVVERAKIFGVPETGTMKNSWAIHQLKTTANFAAGSAFMRWFTGGLTNQIEHHLFPSISHIHYGKLAEIVKKTAKEFKLPYLENKTLWDGLRSHYRLLWRLGREEKIPELDFEH